MELIRRQLLQFTAAALAIPATSPLAWAQSDYPSRPVRIIVGFPAGGQADIVALAPETLPDRIAVALVDVDLQAPTRAALEKIYPRLAPDGAMLVDDCAENGSFRGARVAYREFVAEHRLPERYLFGMGYIGRASP